MAHGPNEHDLLAWIEGEPLDAENQAVLKRALNADEPLRQWAEDARRDRDRLRALSEIEAIRAPQGLTSAAMELAEREALVGGPRAGSAGQQTRRIRITPLRFVAAAGLVIVAGAASLVGFLMTEPTPAPNLLAQHAEETSNQLAMADAASAETTGEMESAALSEPAETVALATQPMDTQLKALSSRTASSLGDASPEVPVATTPSIQFRLIHPSEHAPEHALSPARAAELAANGRTLLLVRAADPAAVESALLSLASRDDATAARWRQLVEMQDGGPGFDAARLVVADALATPGAMQRLIAAVTSAPGGVQGAWLQELADAVKLETTFVAEDLMWWTLPPTAWAPRAAVPVLIERVDPIAPDAEPTDPDHP